MVMKQEVNISVIVPVYNTEIYIEDCIKGLLSQNYPHDQYEVIMVDNNSTDCSTDIIKQYPWIKLKREYKPGSYAARNHGVDEAKGSIIAFTDPDCVPCSEWLRNIAAVMSQPEICIVLGNIKFSRDSLISSMLAAYQTEKAAYVFSSDVKEAYYGYTNNMAIRKNVFSLLGPFMEISRGADSIYVRQFAHEFSCNAIRYSPDVCVRHMEITNILDYYRKQYIYGQNHKKNPKFKWVKTLDFAERLHIFKATCQKQKYSLTQACLLFFILLIGVLYYDIGRKRGG